MSSMVQTTVGAELPRAETVVQQRTERGRPSEGLTARLRGVPKGALQAVLGARLGERAWRHVRGEARWPEPAIADEQVIVALIHHLSRQAAVVLSQAGKQAKFVRLTVRVKGGRSASARGRVARLTQNGDEILSKALSLLVGLGTTSALVQSVELDVTAVADTAVEYGIAPLWSTAARQAAVA
jgi:hypothetical protein